MSGSIDSSTEEVLGGPPFLLLLLPLLVLVALWVTGALQAMLLAAALLLLPVFLLLFFSQSLRSGTGKAAAGAARGFGGAGAAFASRSADRRSGYVDVHRFRLVDNQRQAHDCVMRGQLHGATLKPGDEIDVWGRPGRFGVVNVNKIQIVATGAVLQPKEPFTTRALRAHRYAVWGSAGLLVLLIVLGAAAS